MRRAPAACMAGQFLGVADDRGDVVARFDGLPEELPADAAGRGEDREFHLGAVASSAAPLSLVTGRKRMVVTTCTLYCSGCHNHTLILGLYWA
jgi:predicted cobalt transporter CbtA